jgi:antitoxin component of MazEF toxin-antitoxin module
MMRGRGESNMRKIQKWGNSLAVRIPAKWARRLMLQEGMTIEMCMENNCIMIRNSIVPEDNEADTILKERNDLVTTHR